MNVYWTALVKICRPYGCRADDRALHAQCILWWRRRVWIRIHAHYEYYNSHAAFQSDFDFYSVIFVYPFRQYFCLVRRPVWLNLLLDTFFSLGIYHSLSFPLTVICSLYSSHILLTCLLSDSCREVVSRYMTSTAGITRRPRGCCWSSIRSGVFGHVYWWGLAVNVHVMSNF